MSTHTSHVTRELEPGLLLGAVGALLETGSRLALVAAHDDGAAGFRVVYVFAGPRDARTELVVRLPRDAPSVPSLAALSFSAGRFERAVQDTFGIVPTGHPRPRRLVLHDHWPTDWYPMRHDAGEPRFGLDRGTFSFMPVQGQGVYEIPVGPVHAGMIEPGHFRFSVVGETIVRMKARLWFVHRGMEKLFEGRSPAQGLPLAEVISGDTAVGHGLAFAMAVEDSLGIEVDEPDRLIRAQLLELERLHNHVTDLGAIANDVGFGIVAAHTQRLRERLLRQHARLTGHRLLRGGVQVGGARLLEPVDAALVGEVAAELADVVEVALGSSVVVDRFVGTAVLPAEAASEMGVLGYVARASGLQVDARADHPFVDLGPAWQVVSRPEGDVMARFAVRAQEAQVSAGLVGALGERLAGRLGSAHEVDAGAVAVSADPDLATEGAVRSGLSLVEGWRGTICHRVELDAAGTLTRVAVADPSFFTWPALPVALADTIVPDFPLANKSFNQSYAGNDL